MAKMNSAVKFPFDASADKLLRAENAPALTAAATVDEAPVSLDCLTSYWDNETVPHQSFAVVVNITDMDTTGDGNYDIKIQTGNDEAMTSTSTQLSTDVTSRDTGVFALYLDVDTIKGRDPDACYIRISSTISGTTNLNLDYYAWIVPTAG